MRLSFVPAEMPFEAIERVARHAGALAYDGTDGNPVVGGLGATRRARGFAQGANVQSATANFTLDERYSIYQPSLMSVDAFHDGGLGREELRFASFLKRGAPSRWGD